MDCAIKYCSLPYTYKLFFVSQYILPTNIILPHSVLFLSGCCVPCSALHLCFRCRCWLRVCWISNRTSARVGSDCSCNQSAPQRWHGGFVTHLLSRKRRSKTLPQSQHVPARPSDAKFSPPPGGPYAFTWSHVTSLSSAISVCKLNPPRWSSSLRLPKASGLVYTPGKHVAYWTFFLPPLSLSLSSAESR